VQVRGEMPVAELVDAVVDAGVLRGPGWVFRAYLEVHGAGARLKPGPVRLTDAMTPAQIARRLAAGLGPVYVRVTLPEGFDRHEIATRLEARGVCPAEAFLAATARSTLLDRLELPGRTAEGYLFPDTYELAMDTDPAEVVARMVRTFRRRMLPLIARHPDGLAALRSDLDFGLHQVVTLASIVEKEAARADERPVIAGVFLNRLRSPDFTPKRLQADPTVSYGCRPGEAGDEPLASCAGFAEDGRITRRMLDDPANPYNTIRHEGLPPGPIANPGVSSLEAVLAPARHDYLFFVAAGEGRHHFSRTLSAHERAIRRYLRPEGAEGRGASAEVRGGP